MDLEGLSPKKKRENELHVTGYRLATREARGPQNLRCGRPEPNVDINAHLCLGSPG